MNAIHSQREQLKNAPKNSPNSYPAFTFPSKAGLVTLSSGAHFATTQEVYSINIVLLSFLPSYHDSQQEPASIPCVSAVSPEEAQMRSVSPSIQIFT